MGLLGNAHLFVVLVDLAGSDTVAMGVFGAS